MVEEACAEEQRDIERAVAASLAPVHTSVSLIRYRRMQMMEGAPTERISPSSQRQEANIHAGQIRADLAARNYYIGEEDGDHANEEMQIRMTNIRKTDTLPSPRHLARETIDDRIRELADTKAKNKDNSPSSSRDQPSQRVTIDESIEHMSAIFASELAQINVRNGDTWVFIDPPAFAAPEQDEKTFNRYVDRLKNPLVVSSHKLKALNSNFFDYCLSPTIQYRILRRRELVNKLPSFIKYVVDLTPPSEGDSAAFLMTELCCPEGVRTWSESRWRWSVSPTLVAGIDEFTGPLPLVKPEIREMHLKTPEYSAVRHRSSIERVLNVIHDMDPLLDSAPKVWTTFVIAKYFEITHSPLTDYIVRWLRAYPNSFFIEVMPEITLRIADGIQCQELIRDSFAILVGEEALEGIRSPDAKYTAYGRRKYDVPEPYKTRIEYASKSFLDRISATYRMLIAEDMEWIEGLPEFQKLTEYAYDHAAAELMRKLKAFVRASIWAVSYLDLETTPGRLLGMPGHETLYPAHGPRQFWEQQQPHERRRTCIFWHALKHSKNIWSTSVRDVWEGQSVSQPLGERKQFWSAVRNHGIETVHSEELATLDRLVQRLPRPGQRHLQLPRPDQHQLQLPIRHKVQQDANNAELESLGNLSTDEPQNQVRECKSWRCLDDFGFGGNQTAVNDVDPPPGQPQFQLPIRHKMQQDANSADFELFGHLSMDEPQNPARDREERRFLSDFESCGDHTKGKNVDPLPSSSDVPSKNLRFSHEHPWYARPFEPSSADSHDSVVDDPLYFRHPDRFFLPEFKAQAKRYIDDVCDSILYCRDPERASPMDLNLTLTLVSLNDSEWKYLPLYAGGLDDGSGGVFDDEVPLAETGFSTAGPAIHTGVGSSAASSEFEFVRSRDGDSSFNTSTVVNDGFSDALDRGRVHDADDILLDNYAATNEHPTASTMGDVETESVTSSVLTYQGAEANQNAASAGEADTIKQEKVEETADEEEDNYEDIFSYEESYHDEDEDDFMTEVEDISDGTTHQGDVDSDSDSDMVIL